MKKITKEWLLEKGFTFQDYEWDWVMTKSYGSPNDSVFISYMSDLSVAIADSEASDDSGKSITPSLPYMTHQEELEQFLKLLGHEI
jgi:hypothetical protein